MAMEPCAIINADTVGVKDPFGCRLPCGHQGPHGFVSEEGELFQWETDWACGCEDCLSGDGDFCTVYWRVEQDLNKGKAVIMLAAALTNTGFELCEFEPDECESCHKLAQLYFQGPTDAGRYFCAECVMAESKDNWLTDREAECRLTGKGP